MRSAMPVASRPITRFDRASLIEGRTVPRIWPAVPRPTVIAMLMLATSESTPTQTSQPRQPISARTAAAMGTPTSSVSDSPLITHPSARPRWPSAARPESSA